MLGAIIGDIVGSRFEFNNTDKYDFELFGAGCEFTDDSICTIAVADALLECGVSVSPADFAAKLQLWCRRYPSPMGSYGGSFSRWIWSSNPQPYNSFGNGAAMRFSASVLFASSKKEAVELAVKSAECTHNHEEAIKAVSALAAACWDLRCGFPKEEVCDAYTPFFSPVRFKVGLFDETCQYCVPLAFSIFRSSCSFEDAIRRAVAFGGDSDTLCAIVGALAEHHYGIPPAIKSKALAFLPAEMKNVINRCYKNL